MSHIAEIGEIKAKMEKRLAEQMAEQRNLPAVTKAAAPQFNLAPRNFAEAIQSAEKYARSTLVPQHFRDKPDDCFIMVQLAARQDVDPFMLMQHSYMVGGKPGIEGKYAIAMMNTRGPFKGGVQFSFKGEGDNQSCTAWGIHKETAERCEATVGMDMVKAEGWLKNPKWTSMREQMFAYRAGSFLAKRYCPEVLMGMQTMEELEDIIDITPAQYPPVAPLPPPVPEPDTLLPAELDMHIKDMAGAFERGEGEDWCKVNQQPILARCTQEQRKRFYTRRDEFKKENTVINVESKPRGRPKKQAEPSETSQPGADVEGQSEALLSLRDKMGEFHEQTGSTKAFYADYHHVVYKLSDEDQKWLVSEAEALEGKG